MTLQTLKSQAAEYGQDFSTRSQIHKHKLVPSVSTFCCREKEELKNPQVWEKKYLVGKRTEQFPSCKLSPQIYPESGLPNKDWVGQPSLLCLHAGRHPCVTAMPSPAHVGLTRIRNTAPSSPKICIIPCLPHDPHVPPCGWHGITGSARGVEQRCHRVWLLKADTQTTGSHTAAKAKQHHEQ